MKAEERLTAITELIHKQSDLMDDLARLANDYRPDSDTRKSIRRVADHTSSTIKASMELHGMILDEVLNDDTEQEMREEAG